MIKGLFTSNSEEWETPHDFFLELDKEFGFEIDLCASLENAKCSRFITKEDDLLGLSNGNPWTWYKKDRTTYKIAWMNPPYGRKIKDFVKKAYECSFVGGMTVVCLLPARTDTKWWHDYCQKTSEVRFIQGRLKFSNSKWNAPFPSAIVVFRGSK